MERQRDPLDKLYELEYFLRNENIDICLISEIHLKSIFC